MPLMHESAERNRVNENVYNPKMRQPMRFGVNWWRVALCGVWTALATACTKDDMKTTGMEAGDSYIQLSFSVAEPETRLDLNEEGAGGFSNGDRIGLFVDNGNELFYRQLTYNDGVWQPRLSRRDFGNGELRLSAHYPVVAGAEEDPKQTAIMLTDNQSSDEAWRQSDLLVATRTLDPGTARANLTFTHAMHRLQVQLSDPDLDVQVRSRRSAVVNLLTGKVELRADAKYDWIQPRRRADGRFEALICPQEVAPYRLDEGLLKIVSTEKTVNYSAPETLDGVSFETFEAGKRTQIRLQVEEARPDLANKTLWVYGVHAPDFPGKDQIPTYPPYQTDFPLGAWFRYDYTFDEVQKLTWAEGCGWYDCNKSKDYVEQDGHLCWAAAASNLLIWWMVHNKPYIDAYTKEYGSEVMSPVTGRTFERPAPDFVPLYSNGTVNRAPVFEFFKSLFDNRASWDTAGVNWFITGNIDNLVTTSKMNGFPGFFAEVFSESDAVAVDSNRHPSRKQFNEFVIDALLHKKALGFGITLDGNHGMVIWGVELDAAGEISHVYYCDNNSSEQDETGAVILRKKIVYGVDTSAPEYGDTEYTYLQALDNEDGLSKKKFKIICLTAVDLRRDIWAKKYPSIVVDEED